MSEMLTKIKKKINSQNLLNQQIKEIEFILKQKHELLTKEEVLELEQEKLSLESQKITSNLSFEQKFNDFFYTYNEIENTQDISWLIPNVIPKQSLGVLYGAPGSGKSTLILKYCKYLLSNMNEIFIIYIDGDMSVNKLKDLEISKLIDTYQKRFKYGGKANGNLALRTQELLAHLVKVQENNLDKKYLIIEDSLSLLAIKKQGFIDTNELFRYEKKLRELGSTVIIVHHLNKSGTFADTQHIENYADYTYLIERNEFIGCILLNPKKASRFNIQAKAYTTDNREIIDEVDFSMANIGRSESSFVNIISDLLSYGEMKQSEIIKYLKEISFSTKYSVGEKKIINWLEKWAKNAKWSFEQRASEKNAKYYYLHQAKKLAKLPNYNKKEI